ncbi:protein kinase domain-containing protein [Rhodopirellula sp. MGV]|uniref:protein kinase domain-containing protein n=1 Tax=Rhodopirellula sp. MGV TaxID=2023130 RepID=UPI000B96280D|nr:protein kinase [Rhodopirellula sp. MGV]OYP35757.1 hypothetical protein CGZ80_10785 [Rhodopirellula sp. MGV]PNY33660.1 hypothetical protein C2E31_26505 [Rhodopirellula baltica]
MGDLTTEQLLLINQRCDEYEAALRDWQRDGTSPESFPPIEPFVETVPQEIYQAAVEQLIGLEIQYRIESGQTILVSELVDRFPDVSDGIFIHLLQESLSGATRLADDVATKAPDAGETDEQDVNAFELATSIGQYELLGKLGGGGMGVVYQAVHRSMKRDVAIKIMRGDLINRRELKQRFHREVTAVAKLSHPNIVTAYDAGEVEGRPYLVTELVDGMDLHHYVKRHGPMPWQVAIRSIIDAAEGLKYAHGQRIIHRDIKPGNLLLNHEGHVKILDLGLARLTETADTNDDTNATAQLTHTGAVVGTAAFMAPEQARNTRDADQRSDIYSLGCVLFYLLTGKPPYRGESIVDTLLLHATAPIPALIVPGGVPSRLGELVQEMMAKSPADRPGSMNDIIERLTALQLEDPLETELASPDRASAPVVTHTDPPEFFGRLRAASGLLLGILVFALSAGLFSWFKHPDQPNQAVQFDGSGYIEIPMQSGPPEELTFEMIVRIDDATLCNPLCWLGGNWTTLFHNGNWGIARFEQGEPRFAVVPGEGAPVLGQWQHIAGTWDGQTLRIFVDGQPVAQQSMDFELQPTTPGLFIGGVDPQRLWQPHDQRFFTGLIDAVRISDRVLYGPDESFSPPETLTNQAGVVVLFDFDQPAENGRYVDQSGNALIGTATNVQQVATPR